MAASTSTILAHAGCRADPETGAVVAPLHFATTFERGPDTDYPRGYIYSRIDNPSRCLFEMTMARLEHGVAGAAFGSGMAAIHAVLAAFPGGAVALPDDLYHGVMTLIDTVLGPWGLKVVRYAADGGTAAVEKALDEAVALAGADKALLWLETPSNPLLRIVDIAAACEAARSRGVASAVDATWLTPVLCRPLDLGADVVVHSVTKYIAGHSDVLAGVAVARVAEGAGREAWDDAAAGAMRGPSAQAGERGGGGPAASLHDVAAAGDAAAVPWWSRVRAVQRNAGGVAGPMDCFLAMRGLRTLELRVLRQSASAAALAAALEAHPAVVGVHYPGLDSHPQRALVASNAVFSRGEDPAMCGGMLSVRLRGGEEAARRVASSLRVFRTATSLGGTESLVEHRASIEPKGTATPFDLLRVSVGLEDGDELIRDWTRALDEAAVVSSA